MLNKITSKQFTKVSKRSKYFVRQNISQGSPKTYNSIIKNLNYKKADNFPVISEHLDLVKDEKEYYRDLLKSAQTQVLKFFKDSGFELGYNLDPRALVIENQRQLGYKGKHNSLSSVITLENTLYTSMLEKLFGSQLGNLTESEKSSIQTSIHETIHLLAEDSHRLGEGKGAMIPRILSLKCFDGENLENFTLNYKIHEKVNETVTRFLELAICNHVSDIQTEISKQNPYNDYLRGFTVANFADKNDNYSLPESLTEEQKFKFWEDIFALVIKTNSTLLEELVKSNNNNKTTQELIEETINPQRLFPNLTEERVKHILVPLTELNTSPDVLQFLRGKAEFDNDTKVLEEMDNPKDGRANSSIYNLFDHLNYDEDLEDQEIFGGISIDEPPPYPSIPEYKKQADKLTAELIEYAKSRAAEGSNKQN